MSLFLTLQMSYSLTFTDYEQFQYQSKCYQNIYFIFQHYIFLFFLLDITLQKMKHVKIICREFSLRSQIIFRRHSQEKELQIQGRIVILFKLFFSVLCVFPPLLQFHKPYTGIILAFHRQYTDEKERSSFMLHVGFPCYHLCKSIISYLLNNKIN